MINSANVTVMVSNFDHSIIFYTEILGLKLKRRYGDHFAEIETTGLTIALHPARKNDSNIGISESLSIGFAVDNLESTISDFRNKGIQFSSQIIHDGPVRLIFLMILTKLPFIWLNQK